MEKLLHPFGLLPLLALAVASPACATGAAVVKHSATKHTPAIVFTPGEVNRPNLLWIISDDLGPELGCYGYTGVDTPNLDKLAAEGVRFTRAFASAPVCSPSRSALITGMYQTSIGAHDHRAIETFPALPQGVETLPQLLRRAGYNTSNEGDPMGMAKAGKTDYNFSFLDNELFSASSLAKAPPDKPFFSQVQLLPPHRPFLNQAVSKVELEAFTLPPYYPEHPLIRRDWAAYLQTINLLDEMVGQILRQLEESGQADNTIVIFFGDNGRPHLRNKQWLYEGGLHVPLIIRWPGKIRPGQVNNNLVSLIDLAPTCLQWLGVEVPHWMQGKSFADLVTAQRNFIYAARDRCGDAVDRVRSVRGERYKYIRNLHPELPYSQPQVYIDTSYPAIHVLRQLQKEDALPPGSQAFMAAEKPAEELYDLQNDPYEQHNLAGDPAHSQTLAALSAQLDQWLAQTDKTASYPEPPQQIEAYRKLRQQTYREWLQQNGLSADAKPEAIVRWWSDYYE